MTSKECSTENKEVSGKEPDRVIRKLFRQTLVGIAILVLGVVFLARVFPEPVLAISQKFIEITGVFGVGIGIMFADSLHVFIPPDVFLMIAVAGKLDSILVIASASIGSLIGGTVSYLTGRILLPKIQGVASFVKKHEQKLEHYLHRYGFWAVVLAALTPLPYSWISLAAGTMKMHYALFFQGCLFRIPRFIVFYYLIRFGWVGGGM
ncbi:YqaA family protein [Leptospira borgpetersenii]|uniref:YqaA family protein n=1 Tax=Leptospira borgpetersenii TaxID=174 RepID=UPI000774B22B|nr:VTT domain-containing protein [Leptospira borgpetersenii]MBE8401160.1 VTT domain-containing protein [Leptospira borgpetersenii serovar Tarassovi]MBE8404274.1 VTT domain-containing protein [Leptospira borgpetersenii serovar Tarassovi]MBE8405228.1 VTT domain-containing protein [Leptospira borgpetersenii serovar Tarassovi]MBE8412815.1 VTT domain-containing protein [Leptospira borgpetersenii serovar Tarassovi]MBE8417010.1 VTT domain-containing protein [Leptospira borgpetersenii serovar Tarassov